METAADFGCFCWRDCANAGTQKCSICWNLVRNFGHYVYFKDKFYYMKTMPYIKLSPLFERVVK